MRHRDHFTPGRTADGPVTAGQDRKANRLMDAHVTHHRRCRDADVCVHPGVLGAVFFCVGCDGRIG